MIDEILPTAVLGAESFGDEPDAWLFPEERAALGEAGEARRREYTTVRHCARRALGGLGLAPAPLLPGVRGAPRWPDDVVGSMTHCAGYRAAAAAHRSDVRALGIDAEPHAPLPEGVLEFIALPKESSHVAGLSRHTPEVHWDRLLFCAKEAVYKAWFPATHTWLGFDGAVISPAPDGTFHARVLAPAPAQQVPAPREFDGRWLVRDGFLLASVASPALV
ncbi:4'-phosphopantetheinyl transferase family protein [Streptomyces sp. DH10]|uniref:4'-phosphopantetheinyl transferase family protein n=1 Tax=Streptomyces sp. DH10 TaxID=3040121 RepID=UPI00244109BC|nr:4'-phosphopantetheinyl transferase superfamily protein [Streptomyces sp. DH10]MDG9708993.1 4'-phosphopantetheinyl transferase superfamily protein [Streptomyces sp. DH10]